MCGIFGYTGTQTANNIVFDGLKRLEYRGYDSWGIAVLEKNEIHQYKDIGIVKSNKKLLKLPISNIGIGHTRWATHGGVTRVNAHPHTSQTKDFTLVQNGIVENFSSIKENLINLGYKFTSETDTEVIVKLIEEERKKKKDLQKSLISAFRKLEGRNTIAVLDAKKNCIYAIKNGSPLVLGISPKGIYLASDSLSFSPYTNKVVVLDDFDMVTICNNNIDITNIKTNRKKDLEYKILKYKYEDINKGKYKHFMLKEIVEQKKTIKYATQYTEKELDPLLKAVRKSRRVYILGAGTAGFAAGQIGYFLRTIAKVDAQDVKSYDYRSYLPVISSNDLIIAVSQSGETADTIEPLEKFREKGCKIASIVNMFGTTISRLSDYEYYTNAGPEICVASTKVFTAQSAWGYLLSMSLAGRYNEAKKSISKLSKSLDPLFEEPSFKNIKKICRRIKKNEHFFVLGKGENSFISLEGALKIKEISYKHVEGFSAGELKHGVIALIEKGTPVFGIVPSSITPEDQKDIISGMEQVKARGALTIGIGSTDYAKSDMFDYYIETPDTGLLSCLANVVPFQLISYFISLELGNNIDKPRNLAKSVTVK